VITLIPSTSSLTSPLHYRRNQDVFISSFVDLSCMSLLSINTQWTITSCTPVCSSPIAADPSIITTFAEIYISRRAIACGTYQLNLTVTMASAPNLNPSASAYVTITPSGIIANLARYGASMITSSYRQDLVLDPGLNSIDLDGNTFNASVSVEDLSHASLQSCLLLSPRRIGVMSTFVASMEYQIFRRFLVPCFPSMILE
jgi:REJ domain